MQVQEMQVQSLGGEDSLEKERALNSIIFAWKARKSDMTN